MGYLMPCTSCLYGNYYYYYYAAMGKSQSRLALKSQFEHILIFDLNIKDSIQKIAIRFEI